MSQPSGQRRFTRSAIALLLITTVLAPAAAARVDEHLPGDAPSGYRISAAATSEVYGFGAAEYHGAPADDDSDELVVDMAATPTGHGYWTVSATGAIHAYGDAEHHGDAAQLSLAGPIVGMATTPTGNGYWLAASDGGVFTFGDAPYRGSVAHLVLNRPIVGMAPTASGDGYWLVASDGGVFAMGDAAFHGSTGAITLNKPIVDMVVPPDGQGYWLVASDGGIFSFGTAPFLGSLGDQSLGEERIVAADVAPDGQGYWMASHLGTVYSFGSAHHHGGLLAGREEPIRSMTARPQGDGYWLASAPGTDWLGPPVPPNSGSGRRIVYGNAAQRVWLIEDDETVFDSYLVSGKYNYPRPGNYAVYSKSRHAFADHDGITMEWMVRFAHGRRLRIGFHGIPVYANGRPMQTEEQLGTYRSSGCVRQRLDKAEQLYHWAPIGTPVIVLP